MQRLLTLFAAFALTLPCTAQWRPAGNRIKTSRGEKLGTRNVLAEYPRPQMVRAEWQNLNGLMTYDRKAVKVDEARIRKINEKICNSLNEEKR